MRSRGDSGAPYGYSDHWTNDGAFEFTGEGQVGDMTFKGGNTAIRDHRKDGRDLFLFQDQADGLVRYEGMFECISSRQEPGKDLHKKDRKIIVFSLMPVSSASEQCQHEREALPLNASLVDLRKAALAAHDAAEKGNADPKKSPPRTWYERSGAVRAYVLARAGGSCECCGNPAPFANRQGNPYLEPHHTTRRADDGPDHPAHVAGICPNCHRHVHSGQDREAVNAELIKKIRAKEDAFGDSEATQH